VINMNFQQGNESNTTGPAYDTNGADSDRSKDKDDRERLLLPSRSEIEKLTDLLLDVLLLEEARGNKAALPGREAEAGVLLERMLLTCMECCSPGSQADFLASVTGNSMMSLLPELRHRLSLDVRAAYEGDPACESETEAALCYPGVHAVAVHRFAHELQRREVPLLPRLLSEAIHRRTGIDIHPGARIGASFFIDHGTGVVIGSTTVIGEHCKLYQGVTLGASSVQRRSGEQGAIRTKRHPTLEDHVTVYAGATILGGETVIGAGSVVGGGVFLTESVPPRHFVTNPRPVTRLRASTRAIPLQFHI